MTHDLLHCNLSAALADNVFLLVGIPAFVAWMTWMLHRRRTGKRSVTPATYRVTYIVVAVAALIWTVVRNMPGFPLVPTVYAG